MKPTQRGPGPGSHSGAAFWGVEEECHRTLWALVLQLLNLALCVLRNSFPQCPRPHRTQVPSHRSHTVLPLRQGLPVRKSQTPPFPGRETSPFVCVKPSQFYPEFHLVTKQ